jgi:hypothetical protein
MLNDLKSKGFDAFITAAWHYKKNMI